MKSGHGRRWVPRRAGVRTGCTEARCVVCYASCTPPLITTDGTLVSLRDECEGRVVVGLPRTQCRHAGAPTCECQNCRRVALSGVQGAVLSPMVE